MRRITIILSLIALIVSVGTAQTTVPTETHSTSTESSTKDLSEAKPNIVEKINASTDDGESRIEVIVSDELLEKILTPPEIHRRNSGQPVIRRGINKIQGYRIQVFSDGLNQHSLEARAKARGNAIVAKFPKYRSQVYTFSSSPNWYTRVGNFRSQSEADKALEELKRAFPAFAPEMRVVKCQIVVIK